MKTARLALLGVCLWGMACEASAPPGAIQERLDPTPSEEVEIQQIFNAAACYCEAYLGGRVADYPQDPRLQSFRSARGGGACTTMLWDGISTHGSLPTVRLGGATVAGAREVNGCVPVSNPTGDRSQFPFGGFCRADFNYCVGAELRLQADSLARAPSSRAVRLALLAESRSRFAAAGVEFAGTMSLLDTACGATPTVPDTVVECGRLAASNYELVASARMADSVAQLSDVVYQEAEAYMAASDATALGGERGADLTIALYGEDSARMEAARTVMGPSLGGVAVRNGANRIPARWRESHHAQEAVRLLVTYLAPTTLQYCQQTIPGVGEVRFPAQPPVDEMSSTVGFDYALAVYNYLDRRVAAAQYLEPDYSITADGERYRTRADVTSAELAALAAADASLDPTLSPLRTGYDLRVEHVREGLELLADLVRTMDVEVTTRPVSQRPIVSGTFQVGTCDILAVPTLGELAFNPTGSHLSAALARPLASESTRSLGVGATGTLLARPDDFINYSTPGAPYQFVRRNWYSPNAQFVANRGATGALQILRHHLLRLRDRPGSFADEAAISEVLSLVDAAIGPRWTEHTKGDYLGCFSTPFGCVGEVPVIRSEFLWSLYHLPADPSGFDDGEFVAVENRDDLDCLLRGHREFQPAPGETDSWCAGFSPTVLSEVTSGNPGQVFSVANYHGYVRRTFTRPATVAWGSSFTRPVAPNQVYVLFRRSSRDYELIDVIHRNSVAEVHAFGGAFGDLFDDITARTAMNPGAPAITSTGMPFDLIPPLENSLIDDSDRFEDSWDHYLDQATLASQHATTLLAAARQHEIEILQDDRATSAEFDLAAQAQNEVLSEECGLTSAEGGVDCFGPTLSGVTLVDLGIVVPPTRTTEPILDPRFGRIADRDEVAYLTPGYDNGYGEAFERTFPDEPEVRGVTCSEFIDNIVSLTNLPEPRECADEALYGVLNTLLGSTSATAAFCRLADGDVGAGVLSIMCALGIPGPCTDELTQGYRYLYGRYLTGYMHDALYCIDYEFRRQLSEIVFDQVPERVVSAVRAGEPPIYSDTGGNARLQLIEMHQSIDTLRQQVDSFIAARDRAFDRLDFAATYGEFVASTGTEAPCVRRVVAS